MIVLRYDTSIQIYDEITYQFTFIM
jgi:hypothetical protein